VVCRFCEAILKRDKPLRVSERTLAAGGRILVTLAAPCKKIAILLYSPLLSEFLHPSTSKENPMKRFVIAVVLACVLSGTALAGHIPTGGAPSPGEVPMTECDPGHIPTGGSPSPGEIPIGGLSALLAILELTF